MDGLDLAALDALPVFPLPDLVFFPGTLLPLHIFEPRYREMIADVLAGARPLAVVRIVKGHEAAQAGQPPICDVAGAGVLVGSDRLPDGRYNIMVRGVARVRVLAEHPRRRSYREVRARVLPDTHTTRPETLGPSHAALVALLDQLASAVPEGGDNLRQLARAMPTPAACADVVASAIVRDPDARQTLLELLDPADRLDQVLAYVTALHARFTRPETAN
ncbi:MAG TPA: LON peptidase substrate-binding domain-containing protein [Haliangiales bacterium]|nr:LON peptidase substrate-binding domain-containing protein [Haliangiales bacterium]